MRLLIPLFLSIALSVSFSAHAAEVSGYITDYDTAEGIVGATVEAAGQTVKVDEEGFYQIDVPAGEGSAVISANNYQSITKQFTAVEGEINNVSVSLRSSLQSEFEEAIEEDDEYETVTVLGKYTPPTAAANERDAKAVLDSIGGAQLARFGDSNVASALKRVVGLNLRSNSFVSIRGLDGRYLAATFNGSIMPSLNTTRREVPLGVIPSGVLEGIDVQKGFTADLSGMSTGGTIKLSTKPYPLKPTFKYSIGLTGNPDVLSSDFRLRDYQGSPDVLGISDALQVPGIIAQVSDAVADKEYNWSSRVDALRYGPWLSRDFKAKSVSTNPDYKLGLSFGNGFVRGDWDYGFSIAGSYSSKNSMQNEGVENKYTANDDLNFQVTHERYQHTIDANAMFSAGFNYQGNHKLTFNSLYTSKADDRAKFSEGFDSGEIQRDFIRSVSFEKKERSFFINQLVGENYLKYAEMKWGVSLFNGIEDRPDELSYTFSDSNDTGNRDIVMDTTGVYRTWDHLEDDTQTAFIDFTIPVNLFDKEFSWDLGFSDYDNERQSTQYHLIYKNVDRDEFAVDADEVASFDTGSLFTDQQFIDGNVRLTNLTNKSGRISGKESVSAIYTSVTYPFDIISWEPEVRLGIRKESGELEALSFDPNSAAEEKGGFDIDDTLIEIGFNAKPSDNTVVRGGYSETVARPVYRELVDAPYRDEDFGFRLLGSPSLQQSDIKNYDMRGEYYFNETDNISLALFLKEFENPVERTIVFDNGRLFRFENQEESQLYGLEMDFKKDYIFDLGNVHNVFVSGNVAFIESEVTLTPSAATREFNGEKNTRDMQGQPGYLFNIQVGYDNILTGHKATLLFNKQGEQIFSSAEAGEGEVIEESFDQLDFNYQYSLSDDSALKFSVKNILDDARVISQRGLITDSYKTGTEFSLGFSGKF